MTTKRLGLLGAIMVAVLASGCATYRTESNINSPAPVAASASASTNVVIAEDSLSSRIYKVLGPIEVTIKKLTIFHKDPTKEMANEALTEKARAMGADGVVNVTYKNGIGFTTWGYIEAKGDGVKFTK